MVEAGVPAMARWDLHSVELARGVEGWGGAAPATSGFLVKPRIPRLFFV